jgi:hypothetical protein
MPPLNQKISFLAPIKESESGKNFSNTTLFSAFTMAASPLKRWVLRTGTPTAHRTSECRADSTD